MTQAELLRHVASAFEDLGVAYMIGGSQASVYYGESRFTQDIDLVTDLRPEHVPALMDRFLEAEFYLSVEAARRTRTCGTSLASSGCRVPKSTPRTSRNGRGD